MKKLFLAAAVAALAVACKSSDTTQISDPSTAAGPAAACATKSGCSDAMKAECSDAKKAECATMKSECSSAAKPECSTAKTCPITGAVSE